MKSKTFICWDSAKDAIAYLEKINKEMKRRGDSNHIVVTVREDYGIDD